MLTETEPQDYPQLHPYGDDPKLRELYLRALRKHHTQYTGLLPEDKLQKVVADWEEAATSPAKSADKPKVKNG